LVVERGHVENHNLYTHYPLRKPRMAPYPEIAEQFKQVTIFKYEKDSTRGTCEYAVPSPWWKGGVSLEGHAHSFPSKGGSEEHESLPRYAQPQCWPSLDSILQVMGNTIAEDHADILRMLSAAGPLPDLMSVDEGLVQMQRAAASGLDEPWPSGINLWDRIGLEANGYAGSVKSPGSKYTPTSQCPIPDHRNARPVKSALRGTAPSFTNTQISE
jgi:hypothetical protein